MSCEKYREALIDAAATSGALEGGLAEHLARCSQCRVRLQREDALFAAIDDALRGRVNEGPREGFLLRIRARITHEAESEAGWNPMRTWAGAALALLLLGMAHPWTALRQHPVERSLNGVPDHLQQKSIRQNSDATQSQRGATGISGMREQVRRHSPERSMAKQLAPPEPDVLVPSDEAKAFAQFVARLAGRDEIAEAVVRPAKDKATAESAEFPAILSIDIADLQPKPLRWEEWGEVWDPE